METVNDLLKKKKRCGNCRWFLSEDHEEGIGKGRKVDGVYVEEGRCRRRCPLSGEFPVIDETELCGEFEKREEVKSDQAAAFQDF